MSALTRPLINVYSIDNKKSASVVLPSVFKSPIRPDLIHSTHTALNKNSRQAYAVSPKAGHQTSAVSWGTGRAVARIPRVGGGGTHRSGQAAFGNMCRKGRMFAPTKIWRKWHVKINHNQKRVATASAIAATALPSLVMARGHRIEGVNEIPLVFDDVVEGLNKTRDAVNFLKQIGAYKDVEKVIQSKHVRAGKGKMRNRRYVMRRGPLVIYKDDSGLRRAFRNIPGVEMCDVRHLNLLQLAPGGHMGRFVIWTKSAFEQLESLWGSFTAASECKKDFNLPVSVLSNSDITRIINSDEIQSKLNPAGPSKTEKSRRIKLNPLKNGAAMIRMNPYAEVVKRRELLGLNKKEKKEKKHKIASEKYLEVLRSA